MKMRNYLFAIITLLSFTFSAQESKKDTEKEAFITIDVDGEQRKNLLLLEFLTRDARFSNDKLSKMIEDQRKMNGGTYENQNLRGNKEFGYGSPSLTTVYYDGEVIFGEGINRLYIIDQVRLKDVKTIKRVRAGIDNEIYVDSLEKK
jgi:hypothetical protein